MHDGKSSSGALLRLDVLEDLGLKDSTVTRSRSTEIRPDGEGEDMDIDLAVGDIGDIGDMGPALFVLARRAPMIVPLCLTGPPACGAARMTNQHRCLDSLSRSRRGHTQRACDRARERGESKGVGSTPRGHPRCEDVCRHTRTRAPQRRLGAPVWLELNVAGGAALLVLLLRRLLLAPLRLLVPRLSPTGAALLLGADTLLPVAANVKPPRTGLMRDMALRRGGRGGRLRRTALAAGRRQLTRACLRLRRWWWLCVGSWQWCVSPPW